MVINTIPAKSRFLTPVAAFSAPPSGGVYTLSGVTTLLTLSPGSVYLIDRISWAPGITPYEWVRSAGASSPVITLQRNRNGVVSQLTADSYRLIIPAADAPFSLWLDDNQQGDSLQIAITGSIAQTPETITIDPLRVVVQFAIYEIPSQDYVRIMQSGFNSNPQQLRG